MGRLEVQGIVAVENGLPLVQFRQLDDDDNLESAWQSTPAEAREMAQQIVEASTNAVYDAALVAWAKEVDPEDGEKMATAMLMMVRKYRADAWGLPDQPKDWR